MYNIKQISTLIALFFTAIFAQDKAPDISYVYEANVSADKVWEQVRKMDNIDEVSSFVGKVTWKGPHDVNGERTCTAPDGKGYFIEKIKVYNDAERFYQWQVIEGVPAKNVVNSFRVIDLGFDRSMIVFRSNYEYMQNPNMSSEAFKGFLTKASAEIAQNYVKLAKQ